MCLNPSYAYKILRTNGKYKLSFVDPDKRFDSFVDPLSGEFEKPFLIPCGKCLECRKARATDWATRCYIESTFYGFNRNIFLTLTYDDAHLPLNSSLCKKDFQLFIKNLRSKLERDGHSSLIKYFSCGEYGSRTSRPHYHCIIFNLPWQYVGNAIFADKHKNYSNKSVLHQLWKKGNIKVGDCTPNSCAYVAKYIDKKQPSVEYEKLGLESPFLLMSRRPGIGLSRLELFYKDWESGVPMPNGRFSRIPKIVLSKIQEFDPVFVNNYRKKCENASEFYNILTQENEQLDYFQRLEIDNYLAFKKEKKSQRDFNI